MAADGAVGFGTREDVPCLSDGLAGLVLAVRDAQAAGSRDRMRLCGNAACRWAFYDRSHSHRGMWCDMASCGNRLKNRNLRARRAQAGQALPRPLGGPQIPRWLAARCGPGGSSTPKDAARYPPLDGVDFAARTAP